jgi:hypothetical protein
MMFDKIPPYPVIPVYEKRSHSFRYLFNKKREENKILNKIFPPRPRKYLICSLKKRILATMVLRSRKFYETTFECLENDLTLANLVFKIPAIGVEKY